VDNARAAQRVYPGGNGYTPGGPLRGGVRPRDEASSLIQMHGAAKRSQS
jgi:hypothetical protein